MPFTLEQIVKATDQIADNNNDSYLLSYREILDYFNNINVITYHNFIISVNFAYGWMPRILKLHRPIDGFDQTISILNNVKNNNNIINEPDLNYLKNIINNSLVGTSKLLHFINPETYAIWDKKVFNFIHNSFNYNKLQKSRNYISYLQNCNEVANNVRFANIHLRINQKIGYEVTKYRAIEWVMYMTAT